MTIHTPITFTVKGYDKAGKVADSRTYHTPKLNAFGGHWLVCQRMAETLRKNRKVKSIRYFMDGVEYVFCEKEIDFIKA